MSVSILHLPYVVKYASGTSWSSCPQTRKITLYNNTCSPANISDSKTRVHSFYSFFLDDFDIIIIA